ncbi:MAG TPA: polysaccharide pyruvyl transferase family protein [Candidatus Sulfotelmatobacter sp.]|nr:polysaccharide pyruvyl transferase family protein [Candidatus Sulfotelmatobacter sp.]
MKPRVLLVGYNGANNTGAEAKLLVCIDEIRSILGPETQITVPSLNETNLRRYLSESPTLKIKGFTPASVLFDIRKFVKQSDLVLLVEGSCYMDTWGSALLWCYLLATRNAHSLKKPCVAYAVDAGSAGHLNSWLIRREASKTDLILARTASAAERLKKWGVKAPMEVTADNAFAFQPIPEDQGLLKRVWPEASHVVGVAAEDIYAWPVHMRLWDQKKYCYRWPYYYTHSRASREKSDLLAKVLAVQSDDIIEEFDKDIALLSMEGLDAGFANKVQRLMKHPERTKVFTSLQYNASQITSILRSLELLITSRYHAGVLSLPKQVPQTAIGHDLRIRDLYADLDMSELFTDHEDPLRFWELSNDVGDIFDHYDSFKERLKKGYEMYRERESRNPQLLKAFIERNYSEWLD